MKLNSQVLIFSFAPIHVYTTTVALFLGDNDEEKQALFVMMALLFKGDSTETQLYYGRISGIFVRPTFVPMHVYAESMHACSCIYYTDRILNLVEQSCNEVGIIGGRMCPLPC